MAYYHVCSTHLRIGSIIEPGNWGRIIKRVGPQHSRWLAESAMEDVRKKEFSDLPSRLECAFFFDNPVDARHYHETHAQILLLYVVELEDASVRIHRADYRGNVPDSELSLEWCRRYWRGQSSGSQQGALTYSELLAITPLRVTGSL